VSYSSGAPKRMERQSPSPRKRPRIFRVASWSIDGDTDTERISGDLSYWRSGADVAAGAVGAVGGGEESVHYASQVVFHLDRQFNEAAAAGKMALALSGRNAFALASQATIYADWDKIADAQAIYSELVARAACGYILYVKKEEAKSLGPGGMP
jgi:hypothetical protein